MTSVFVSTAKISKAKWLKYFYWQEYKEFQKKIVELYESSMFFVQNVIDHYKECEQNGTDINANISRYFKWQPQTLIVKRGVTGGM